VKDKKKKDGSRGLAVRHEAGCLQRVVVVVVASLRLSS